MAATALTLDRRLGHATAGLLPGRRRLGRPLRHLGIMRGLLARMALLRPRFDRGFCAGNRRQTLLAPRQFLRDLHPVRHVRLIGRLGFRHQRGHLGLELRLDLARVLIRQRPVTTGIGVDLGSVQRHRPQLQHAHLAGQAQHLSEQRLDLPQKTPSERSNGVVIRMLVGGDEAERHGVISRPFQLAAGKHPGGIAINDQTEQQLRVIGCFTRSTVAAGHRPQIQPLDHLNHEPCQVPLRQPLVHRRRHQKAGVPVDQAEVAHAADIQVQSRAKQCTILPDAAASR